MKNKTKILFVCHGNICRSPMAEYLFKDMVKKEGLEDYFEIASAATSTEELGNPCHYGTRNKLMSVGISCKGHAARQMTNGDYDYFDLLIGMDSANIRNMTRISGGDSKHKIYKMLEFVDSSKDVADPWYTDNFDETYDDILMGCTALLEKLQDGSI